MQPQIFRRAIVCNKINLLENTSTKGCKLHKFNTHIFKITYSHWSVNQICVNALLYIHVYICVCAFVLECKINFSFGCENKVFLLLLALLYCLNWQKFIADRNADLVDWMTKAFLWECNILAHTHTHSYTYLYAHTFSQPFLAMVKTLKMRRRRYCIAAKF